MNLNIMFFANSILLGVGLAMDAFCVSTANGMSEPFMKTKKLLSIAGVFAVFQAIMPILGWVFVHTVVEHFKAFEKFIPWIALILLCYIGCKMLFDGIKCNSECPEPVKLGISSLLAQGIATSIDALSVGFTIADYDLFSAIICAIIIATVTFVICTAGLIIGKKFGTALSNKAQLLGGVILIFIGIEIFITGIIK